MQTNTVISEDRFLMYKHLKSMREISAQLEDALQKLVDARYSLEQAFADAMTPEVQQVICESIGLGAQLEALYLANEDHISYVENILREWP